MYAVSFLPDIAFQRGIFCLAFSVSCLMELVRDVLCCGLTSLAVVMIGFNSVHQHSFKHVSCAVEVEWQAKTQFFSVSLPNVQWKQIVLLLMA